MLEGSGVAASPKFGVIDAGKSARWELDGGMTTGIAVMAVPNESVKPLAVAAVTTGWVEVCRVPGVIVTGAAAVA